MGCTGAGKSTIGNVLLERDLKVMLNKYQKVYIDSLDRTIEPIIANNLDSTTKLTSETIRELKGNKHLIIDQAGNGDSVGPYRDIVNLFM